MISGSDLRKARVAQSVSLYKMAAKIRKSVGHLSRIEREADGRMPSPEIIRLYEGVLGINVAATVVSGHATNLRSNVEDVNRRDMLKTAAAVSSATVAAASLAVDVPSWRSRKVQPADIEQVNAAIAAFSTWDHAFGGGRALEVGRPHLDWAYGLLKNDCDRPLRSGLFSAVGGLVAVAGFMAFDAFQHQQAREYFNLAQSCADEADDKNLEDRVLSSMARQAVWCGKPKDALAFIDRAMSKAAQHTPTELAELWTIRARALAKMGPAVVDDARRAVAAADDHFGRSEPANDPEWIKFYDSAQHHGDTAHALFDLETRGHKTDARQRFEFAILHHAQGFTRSRTFSQLKLSALIMATGDPGEASAVGGASIVAASRIRSQRARTELLGLRDTASKAGEAGELIERIDEAIADSQW
jgi:transcriptional regulator with XRE-family HTH domain